MLERRKEWQSPKNRSEDDFYDYHDGNSNHRKNSVYWRLLVLVIVGIVCGVVLSFVLGIVSKKSRLELSLEEREKHFEEVMQLKGKMEAEKQYLLDENKALFEKVESFEIELIDLETEWKELRFRVCYEEMQMLQNCLDDLEKIFSAVSLLSDFEQNLNRKSN